MRLSGRFRTCCASHSRYHLKSSKLVIVRRVGNSSLLDEIGKHSKMDRIDESTLETGIAVGCEPASSQWMANRHRIKRHGEVLQRSFESQLCVHLQLRRLEARRWLRTETTEN